MRERRTLQRIATAHGIQVSYLDMVGECRECVPEVLAKVIRCFAGAERDPDELLIAANHRKQEPEPILVAWEGKVRGFRTPRNSRAELTLEDGQTLALQPGSHIRALPLGYHTLAIETDRSQHKTLVISAPTRSYSDTTQSHAWGVFCPMYALHSKQNPGVGHFGTWREFVDWLQPFGASVVATLPLLAAFLDAPFCEPSPYSPASRFFWNEFYVDLGERARQRGGSLINYAAEAQRRRRLLEEETKRFFARRSNPRLGEFLRFVKEHPHLESYSQFRAACDATRKPWHSWSERMRNGLLRSTDYRETDRRYHAYAQWKAHEQMNQLLEHCRNCGMKFYLDLPLGVHPDSYDVWRETDSFALEATVGAPPDPCFTRGQDWGFAPLHPQRLRENHYRYFREYIAFQMRHTGLLRIDHVMGLHRLYWIPKGSPASEGAYVSYPADELYAILCLESHRNKTVLAGENLGTVPPEVNGAMARRDLRQTYVAQYELQPRLREALRPPPSKSVASLNTHDMPPFAAFMRGDDIDDRDELGLIPKGSLKAERQMRRKVVHALGKFLKSKTRPRALLEGTLQWLAKSRAEMVLINLEDLWLETLPQNVPGTSTERPNWRRRARLSLDEIKAQKAIAGLLRAIATSRAGANRGEGGGRRAPRRRD